MVTPGSGQRMRSGWVRRSRSGSRPRSGSGCSGATSSTISSGARSSRSPLKDALADQSVRGPAAILDLADQLRLRPAHALLGAGGQRVARACGFARGDLVELRRAAHRDWSAGIAGADAAGVVELALVVVAEHQRADRALGGGRGHVAEDDEFLPQHALGLEPMRRRARGDTADRCASTRCLRARGGRRARTSSARPASRCSLKRIGELGGRPPAISLQQRLAIEQRRLGEVEAFAIEKVEQEVAEAVAAARAEIRLQQGEARDAGGILDDDLAVEQRGAQPELRQRCRDGRKPRGPVEPLRA